MWQQIHHYELPRGSYRDMSRARAATNFMMGVFVGVAVISAKNHKRQRRKRQSVTAKREKSQTPKVLTAILTLPNLT